MDPICGALEDEASGIYAWWFASMGRPVVEDKEDESQRSYYSRAIDGEVEYLDRPRDELNLGVHPSIQPASHPPQVTTTACLHTYLCRVDASLHLS